MTNRSCTCHPDDNPPVPCPQKFALSECKAADALERVRDEFSSWEYLDPAMATQYLDALLKEYSNE